MCGIAGAVDFSCQTSADSLRGSVAAMTRCLGHRGPDDEGLWIDAPAGVALGHRRLAILDLSPLGHQPMISASARYILVFNGEIYNFRELRCELQPYPFHSQSDTEVLLAAFDRWGAAEAVTRFNGMFAFALWDRQSRALYLARDRMGEKPLYYTWINGIFVFASELKALRACPEFDKSIDRNALALFMRYAYVPAPHSIYQDVFKLPPAHWMTVTGASHASPQPYWRLDDAIERGRHLPFAGTLDDAIEALDTLLRDAVKIRMAADVPLGAFLSGGVDSSAIVALMQAQSSRPVRSFTIGFHTSGFNEAPAARAIAQHLGTQHLELYATPQEALDCVPDLPCYFDEPFADSSQIPACLIARLARQHVTVSLSGDGGDEVFGGYVRYLWTQRIWRFQQLCPSALRPTLASAVSHLPPSVIGRFAAHPADKLQKLVAILNVHNPAEMYASLVSQWNGPNDVVVGACEPPGFLQQMRRLLDAGPLTLGLMHLDSLTYLPDDILTKVDRATMAFSLESRAPYLDPRIVEFAWSLPLSMKIRHGQTKWILRRVLDKYLPVKLFARPKSGFAVPVDRWLRGPLRDWAEALLEESRLRREGFFHPAPIRQKWNEHLQSRHNWIAPLWCVLMFEAWLAVDNRHGYTDCGIGRGVSANQL